MELFFAPYDISHEIFKFFHIEFEKEELVLSDGGVIYLMWHEKKPDPKSLTKPILVSFGGLNGDVQTGYNKSLCRKSTKEGF